jgi:large subunit ribosomal protein L1
MKHGKKYQDSVKAYDLTKQYEASEAIDVLLGTAKAKFDETVELHVRIEDAPRSRIDQESTWS